MNKIQDIIQEIKKLKKQLLLEFQKKEEEYFYRIKGTKFTLKKKPGGTIKPWLLKCMRTCWIPHS
jgi:hypothetical protein